jgi:hypothetical protein
MDSKTKPSRRGFIWAAAATGAAATAVAVLPKAQVPEAEVPAAEPRPAPERGGGYRVSEHIERYYKSTRV